ncbi:MAG: HIG1 domain-containing protein [Proteobacteria bacterium]|nr:HIG1 domain-containing protein [Pseudomonadota bacterium]
MESFQLALMIIALVATLAVVVVGVVSFATHGEWYIKHANQLMRARVIFQGIVLAVIAVVAWIFWISGPS